MLINDSPLHILKQVMSERKWYGEMERKKAAMYKSMVKRGKMSTDQAAKILRLLGWEKVEEETWMKK